MGNYYGRPQSSALPLFNGRDSLQNFSLSLLHKKANQKLQLRVFCGWDLHHQSSRAKDRQLKEEQ